MTAEKFFIILILIPINFMLGGYTSQMLWRWFVAPTFGLQELSFLQAIGISLIIKYWTVSIPNQEDSNDSLYIQYMGFIISLVCLVNGYVIHLFM